MRVLTSHLCGAWQQPASLDLELLDPTTDEVIARAGSASGLGQAVGWARERGGRALRALSWRERGRLLDTVCKALQAHRDELLDLAAPCGGSTRGDAKFDVDGGIAVLAAYAELAEQLPDTPWRSLGESAPILRSGKLRVQHVLSPRRGLAIHVNAFNFPVWGLLGKAAVAWLAGMPVLTKPATATAALAHRVAELVYETGALPEGALSLLCGPVGDLLDHVGPQDVIAFTGSARTGAAIAAHPAIRARGARVNLEADSLNAAVIGPDVRPGSELWDRIVTDLVTEQTQKAGQKCTATRRIIVPRAVLAELREVLTERLSEIAARTGDPRDKQTRMGPLATRAQLRDARAGLAELTKAARIVVGDPERTDFPGVPAGRGCFLEPILLEASAEQALAPDAPFHHHEVFGPVATLLPYDGALAHAAELVALGGGSLVGTLYTDDRDAVAEQLGALAPWLGRLVLGTEKSASVSLPPGGVLPAVQHGGPGRAGDGAELGGELGLALYTQRTAIQGGAAELARLFGR